MEAMERLFEVGQTIGEEDEDDGDKAESELGNVSD